jgi:hypothetical protein
MATMMMSLSALEAAEDGDDDEVVVSAGVSCGGRYGWGGYVDFLHPELISF